MKMVSKKLLCLINMDKDAREEKIGMMSDYEREELLLDALEVIEELDDEGNYEE